jgi:hypothetical protein
LGHLIQPNFCQSTHSKSHVLSLDRSTWNIGTGNSNPSVWTMDNDTDLLNYYTCTNTNYFLSSLLVAPHLVSSYPKLLGTKRRCCCMCVIWVIHTSHVSGH